MSQAASHLQLSVRYLQGHLLSNLASKKKEGPGNEIASWGT